MQLMIICTSLQTDNHVNTSPVTTQFFTDHAAQPTASKY